MALIFIGISLAVGFQNWNEDRKQNLEAEAIIERLLSEVRENKASITGSIRRLENRLLHIEGVLQKIGPDYKQHDEKLIDNLIYEVFGTPRVIIGNGTLLGN